jgi:serine/threonine-protein kinase HipA
MTGRRLDVWCFGHRAGALADDAGGLRFDYDDGWVTDRMPPLSQSLPLDGGYSTVDVVAFFGGLLPEGAPRELLARQLGISAGNDFGLLQAVGGDTAGAVSLLEPGETPPSQGRDVRWLDERELAQEIRELPSRPMLADEDGEYRLSLAGVQDKLPVIVDTTGRVGLTKGATPSTHILKTPIARFDDTVANEALSLSIGRLLGVATVDAIPRRAADQQFLLVERYDRTRDGDQIRRLHQEDFCQALGIPSERKYQSEGGPSLADAFSLLRRAATVPARETPKLLDYLALSYLVGNNDAHGKNYSLLYLPTTPQVILAPAYDVLSTIVYRGAHQMSRKMAMSIGREYRPDYVRPRHLDRLLDEAGLGPAAARRRLRALAQDAPGAARSARAQLAADGWDEQTLGGVLKVVDERAQWLRAIAASQSRAANARTST